jgi:hypothetical protein
MKQGKYLIDLHVMPKGQRMMCFDGNEYAFFFFFFLLVSLYGNDNA